MKAKVVIASLLSLSFIFLVSNCSSKPTVDNSVTQEQNPCSEDNLCFFIELDEETYSAEQPIQLTLKLINRGVKPLIVKTRFAANAEFVGPEKRDIDIQITDPHGEIIPFDGVRDIILLNESYFVTLKSRVGTLFEVRNVRVYYRIDQPGEYSLQVVYYNEFDPGNGTVAWKGTLVSNTLRFTIEP